MIDFILFEQMEMEWTYVQPQSIADVVPHFGCSNTRVTIAGINLYGGTLATFWGNSWGTGGCLYKN